MRIVTTLILFLLFAKAGISQNKTFAIGTTTPNANAALQVDAPSGNQGVLLPRLTTAQRNAMSLTTADKGLVVFDTDLNLIHTWNGLVWGNGTIATIAQKIIIPYKDSVLTTMPVGTRLLALKYNGTSNTGIAQFQNYSATNNYPVVAGLQQGLGFAGSFVVNNPTNGGTALSGSTNSNKGGTLAPVGVYGESTGTGSVGGAFWNTNAANAYPALYSRTLGTGNAARFEIVNAANSEPALFAQTNGTGYAIEAVGSIKSNGLNVVNSIAGNTALYAEQQGTGPVIVAAKWLTANGHSGWFINNNNNNSESTLRAESSSNAASASESIMTGASSSGYFEINNATSGAPAIFSTTNGTGAAIQGETSTGFASIFALSHANSQALSAVTDGVSSAGYFRTNNPSSSAPTIYATTNGTGSAINGETSTGFAAIYGKQNASFNAIGALFETTNTSNNYPPLQAVAAGNNSNGIYINHTGSGGNLAVFANTDVAAIRFDKTGRGFFNGGTQNSGADVAELFDVEGSKKNYEPGDVLVISASTDRTVEKSFSSNSTKVAGVYATKPGVTLTERGVEESVDDLVPMGVIGVIPTKVCDENGPIKRGDLLVTSSAEGHAMKAKPSLVNGVEIYPTGAVLGKALENWDAGRGLIKVLVNVK